MLLGLGGLFWFFGGFVLFIVIAGGEPPEHASTDQYHAFTCEPLRPFVVSESTPLINQSSRVQYELHACDAETLWAAFDWHVDNVTTTQQWPCVAPLPTVECHMMWATTAMWWSLVLVGFIALCYFAKTSQSTSSGSYAYSGEGAH